MRALDPWFRGLNEVQYEWAVLRAVHAGGGPVAEPIGEPVVDASGVWSMFEWVDGAPISNASDAHEIGALLRRLHTHTDRLVSIGQRPMWIRHHEFFTSRRGGARLTLEEVLSDFERDGGPNARRLGWFARAVHERLREVDLDALPHTVAHGDFGPHQILRRADGSLVVIDWDFCHLDLRATDVAIGSSFTRPDMARVHDYSAAFDLAPEEVALLADLRRAFHLTNFAVQVCVLWVAGIDVSDQLALITERLEREQWFGPLLVSGAQRVLVAPAVETDLDVAHALADRASVVAMSFFQSKDLVTETKDDLSPVTDADRAVELLLRHCLAGVRSDDAVLGEEFGSVGSSPRTWVLDPIDGTNFFAAGSPEWRIQIALEDDGEFVVALVDMPAVGVRWWATRGGGTFERAADGSVRRLEVSTTSSLADAVLTCYPEAVAERLPPEAQFRSWRRLSLPEVIRGEIEAFYVDCCQVWDHAPWVLLVEEAGGRFTDHEGGRSPAKRGGLYSNAAAHNSLLAAIRTQRDRTRDSSAVED